MADPRPLTRKELAEFLPNQRAIRAFEALFNLIPDSLDDQDVLAQEAVMIASKAIKENHKLKNRINDLEIHLFSQKKPNIDQLAKRVEVLESLVG